MAETKCEYFKEGRCCCGHSKWLRERVSGTMRYPPCKDCENFKPAKRDRP